MDYKPFSSRAQRMLNMLNSEQLLQSPPEINVSKNLEINVPNHPEINVSNNPEVKVSNNPEINVSNNNPEINVSNNNPENNQGLNENNDEMDDGDFGSSSSDDYIPDSEESSDSSCGRPRNTSQEEVNVSNNPESSFTFFDNTNITREGRKRKTRTALVERRFERTERTILRNQGKAYVTKNGKFRREKTLRELPDCRAKCNKNIPRLVLEDLFREYYNLGSYDKRVFYISNFIEIGRKKVSKIDPKKKREYTNKYILKYNNEQYYICKKCFLITFDESNRFVQTVCEKKIKFGNVIIPSQKGRAASYKKISDERLELVKDHILRFPAYESHYGRSKTNKKFLSSDLSLSKMYDLYKETTTNTVSKTVYNHVFRSLNLSFKQPSVDTCQKCDRLNKQIETSASNATRIELKTQLDNHQAAAAYAYDQKNKDKIYSKETSNTLTLTFDLQQCLPTPYLKTGMVFYKRQLWTYNLTIHDCASNRAYCYMWDESVSGRGANQIASCLYDFIKNQVPIQWPNVTKLIFYSDTCAGQNKNSIMATMMLLAIRDLSYIYSIEHKFLIPGHTRMEVDSDHSAIERAKKRTNMNIHHPRDWAQLIRSIGKPGKFTVVEMTESNFYDFNDFAKQYLTIKKTNDANEKFVWADVKLMKFDKNWFPRLKYKTDLQNDDLKVISFGRRGKNYGSQLLINNLKHLSAPSFISNEKKKDLLSLLPFIDIRCHAFYNNLQTKADTIDIDPDIDSSDED